jgi:hypothetical protein
MKLIENILVVLIVIGIAIFGYAQWRKTRKLQKIYGELSEEEKKIIDRQEYQNPNLFAYAKPMNKGMWIAAIIGVGIFIWALVSIVITL